MFAMIASLLLGMFLSQQEAAGVRGTPMPGLPNIGVELGLNPSGEIQSLLIYHGQQLTQTLNVCTDGPVSRNHPSGSLATADYNFDGSSDLALQVTADKKSQRFCVWLFDPQQQRFELSTQLSDLTNPIPNAKTRTVVATTFAPCLYCYDKQEFRWSGKELELVQEDSMTADPLGVGSGGCNFIRTVKKRKNGEMQETSRERTDSFGNRC